MSSFRDSLKKLQSSPVQDIELQPEQSFPELEHQAEGNNELSWNTKSTADAVKLNGAIAECGQDWLRWFLEMPERVQDERYLTAEAERRAVYRQLMNRLDAVEGAESYFSFSLTAVQVAFFSILLIVIALTLTMERISYSRFLRLRKWQYVVMVMAVASSLSIVRIITFLLSRPVLWWWRIHKYVVYFVRELKCYADITLWLCIIFLSWHAWFRPRLNDVSETAAHRITWFLSALCIGSILFLLKNILYFKLEADLHYDQLFHRIKSSVLYLHGLQIIHNRGMWRFLPDNKTKKKLMKTVTGKKRHCQFIYPDYDLWTKGENLMMLVLEIEKESVPIWILRRLTMEYLELLKFRPLPGKSDIITKDDREILTEAKKMFEQLTSGKVERWDYDIVDAQINWEDLNRYGLDADECRRIFKSLKQHEEEEDEAEESSSCKGALSGERSMSYYEFLSWAVTAFKTCWALEPTLNSSERVFTKLNRLLNLFLLTLVLIIWLLLSNIISISGLILLLTPLLAASFAFGDSCKKMFEGLVFAFAMHPFNCGDRVIIQNEQMRVTEVNILTSCFHKYDTKEKVVIPNSTLATTNINNLNITPTQSEKIIFYVHIDTPSEDVKNLQIKLKKHLDDNIEYSSNNMVLISGFGDKGIGMVVHFEYFVSYVTAESIAVDKSNIWRKIMDFVKQMDETSKKTFSSSADVYIVDVTIAPKVKLRDIEDLENEILGGIDERYRSCCKTVIKELTRSKVKIGLYVYHDFMVNVEKNSKRDEEDDTNYLSKRNAFRGRVRKNLDDMPERLKRNKFVKEVLIYIIQETSKVEHKDL